MLGSGGSRKRSKSKTLCYGKRIADYQCVIFQWGHPKAPLLLNSLAWVIELPCPESVQQGLPSRAREAEYGLGGIHSC